MTMPGVAPTGGAQVALRGVRHALTAVSSKGDIRCQGRAPPNAEHGFAACAPEHGLKIVRFSETHKKRAASRLVYHLLLP